MRRGHVVEGRFEIEARAGRGGMGTVYRARDRLRGGPVALKTLRSDDPGDLARFEREARLLGRLEHPGVPAYVAHGADGETAWLAMEWLDGESLGARLERGRLEVGEALALAAAVASVLAAAHRAGVVHRDVKPSNLFLESGRVDRVRLLDFGVALLEGAGDAVHTATGIALGTPGFMAPEQAKGRAVGPAADVFALGAVLYRCLAGAPAWTAESPIALLLTTVLEEPVPLALRRDDLPPAVEALVRRMMAKDPGARPADGAALAAELAALDAVKAAPGPAPAVGSAERRLVSVLLAARPGPLSIPWLTAIAARHGGRLERLADGSFAVLLESPTAGHAAATDQAARAARCALACRDSAPDEALALATGRVEVGGAAAGLVGEALERAAALLRQARPGAIVMDEVTAGLLDERFERDGATLRAERAALDAVRTLLGRPTPCVGRVRELGFLEAIWAEAVAEPSARAALVVGPAGIGKSRLRYELLARLATQRPAPLVLVARGDPMSSGSPFGLLAPVLRRLAGVRDGEPPARGRERLRARLAAVLPAARLDEVADFLDELAGLAADPPPARVIGARLDPVVMGDRLRGAFGEWLAAETAAQPVLLAVEDLHWGDVPSVQLIDAALAALAERPFMVLALARPEVDELFPRLWSARPLTRIAVAELSRRAGETLVREVLGPEVAAGDVARLVELSAGNAFYLEELIRAVAEGRAGALPRTVLAMAQARLEGLEPEARRVLRAASLFGGGFWRSAVERLTGQGARLGPLADAEVITRRPESRFPGEEEFVFRHALLQEAAYAMLTDEDRRAGHLEAGGWLEARGETDAMVLAEHFERAGTPARALGHYLRAAEQALEGNDFEAAARRARRAVACGAAGETLGALHLIEAEAHRWRASHAETERAALEALRRLPPGAPAWYVAAGLAATAAGNLGKREALVAIDDALAGQAPTGDARTAVMGTAHAAVRLAMAGEHGREARAVARLEALAAPLFAEPLVSAWLERTRAMCRALAGDDPSAMARGMRLAAAAFDAAGDRRNACLQRGNAGYGLLHVGAYEEAEAVLRAARGEAAALGLANVVTSVSVDLGLVLVRLGRLAEARAWLEETVAACVAQGIPRLQLQARMYLARACELAGDLEAAEDQARRAVETARASDPSWLATALATLARVRLARGDVEDALGLAGAAVAHLGGLGIVGEGDLLVRLVQAEALAAAGREAEARAVLAEARERLLTRAEKIPDAATRASFLERVPVHARILALAGSGG